MIDKQFDKETFKKSVKDNVKFLYRRKLEEATQEQLFQAVSYTVKDVIIDNWLDTQNAYEKQDPKIVYYMSMEFLMGRALGNNLLNLGAYGEVKEALEELGIDINALEDQSRIQHLETAVLEDLQHASLIPLLHLDTVHMDAESVTVMVCSNRKSETDTRLKYRMHGLRKAIHLSFVVRSMQKRYTSADM